MENNPATNLLKADWFRDKCDECGLWTIFEMALKGGEVFASCSRCGDCQPFAYTVTEARSKSRYINHKVAQLELEYPQLAQLRRLGGSVELPWFVERDEEMRHEIIPLRFPSLRVTQDGANLPA